ncbi:MAG: hypothetical protein JO314_05080 [Acidobacteria bacterium]|nr:hypothetical protein [Acidobacteriota bacterium]
MAENTGGAFLPGRAFYWGQSFTTVPAVPETNIAFNFFSDTGSTTPSAFGTAFLLSSSYLGTPADLSPATPGYIAQANASGGFYTFPHVTLQPGTQYWVYTNASAVISGGNNTYPGGTGASTGASIGNFSTDVVSVNFRVTGSPVTTAASVTISGRVLSAGSGVRGARVVITDQQGRTLITYSNAFGYYQVGGVSAGQAYVISGTARGLTITPRLVSVTSDLAAIDLIATAR